MRLKVVVIENDEATLRILNEQMDWASLDCELAGQAADGEAGRQLILEKKPDIILSGIHISKMNGLDMLESIRPALPESKIILITKHARFPYALRAIKLGACDYLLKPVTSEDVQQSVRRAVAMSRSKQAAEVARKQVDTLKRQAQLLALLTNDSQRGQGVNEMLADARLGFEAYYIMVLQLPGERFYSQATLNRVDAAFARHNANAVTILLYDSVVVFVMRNQGDAGWQAEAAALAKAVMAEMKMPLHIASSQLHTSRHAIRQAYYQARQALWEVALSKQTQELTFYQDHQTSRAPSERVAETHRRIDELIEKADLSDAAAEKAAAVLVELSGHQYSNLRAMIALYTLALQKKYADAPDQKTDTALFNTWFVSSESDARECLLQLSAALRSLHETPKHSLLIRNSIQYINLHAIEGIQLNDVAEKLCVSSNYLSMLIRKETGVTFHDHVLRAKMAVARSMLADPRILVDEVARAVGYGNYISFYNAFKRVEHMTPTEFRNQKAGVS